MWCCTISPSTARVSRYASWSMPRAGPKRPTPWPPPTRTPLHTRGTLPRGAGIASHPYFRLRAAATKHHPTHAPACIKWNSGSSPSEHQTPLEKSGPRSASSSVHAVCWSGRPRAAALLQLLQMQSRELLLEGGLAGRCVPRSLDESRPNHHLVYLGARPSSSL